MKNELQSFFEQPKNFNDLEYNISFMNNVLYLYKQVEPNFQYRLVINNINIGDNLIPDMTYKERFNFEDMSFEINYNNPYLYKNKCDWLQCNIPKYLTMLVLEWLEPSLINELIQALTSNFSEYMKVGFDHNAFILNYKIFLNEQLYAEAVTDSKPSNFYYHYTETETCIFQNNKLDIRVESSNLYFPLVDEIETIVPHQLYCGVSNSNQDTYSKLDVNSLLNFCYNKGIKQSLKNAKMRKSFGLLNFNK